MLKVETSFKLPKEFEVKGSPKTLAQAVRVFEDRAHLGFADTKTRAEIKRTKKKLYKQKGTGGARHGAKSAPIFVGGGVTFGPKPNKRKLKISNALKRNALKVALSMKAKDGKVAVVSGFSTLSKTKEVAAILSKLGLSGKKATIALSDANMDKTRFVRNIKNVMALNFKALNAYQVFVGGTLVVDKDALSVEKAPKTETKKVQAKAIKTVKKTVKKGAK